MRSAVIPVTVAVLLALLAVPGVSAQAQTPRYIVLYAHSFGESGILNAIPQWTGQKAADISAGVSFRLSPVLGGALHILGGITFVLYLRASASFFGTVRIQISELRFGVETLVPGARVDTPLNLDTRTVPVTLGVGIIDHQFQSGSSIVLHIGVDQTSSSGTPLLVWDDPSSPTSVRLPSISPPRVEFSFVGEPNFGTVFPTNSAGNHMVRVRAVASDVVGVSRFTYAAFQFTATNGSLTTFQVNTNNDTDYSGIYSFSTILDRGQWQVGFILRDLSGETYGAVESLWIAPFYPVSINVIGSDGTSLRNATLRASFRNEAVWSALTNASGWGKLSLPSTQILGPLNLTIGWLGTETLSTLDVVGASTFLLKLPVFDFGVRVTMNGFPLPASRVILMQKGVVEAQYTGVNGVASFKTVPVGNYTFRTEYLFVSYDSRLSVKSNDLLTIAVPFPHQTITLIGAILLATVVSASLIHRRRSKVYPTSFSYFKELTQGGLQDACFTVISGNSGSGKSVLLNSIAAEHLESRKCVYVTNTEFPDKIRDGMVKLGICDPDHVKPDRLFFIDAYSAIGGGSSKVEYFVVSHTDLTSLGLNISKCLELAGPGADVYFDSLNPLITALRIDYLINFLQSVATKVKANNGKLCVTIGSGIEKSDMTKLEENSDCVIETQLQETSKGQRRRLRIKKLRDKPYIDRWTRFRVEEGKGIIFLTRSKPKA
ncbi:MAG: ATPase domain-containing protein [Candidatus Bathyarchaeia archaeon]